MNLHWRVHIMQVTLANDVELAAPDLLYSILTITNVYPPLGSIGGGTLLTIVGWGFDASSPSSNVVVVPVPVSTSYPNGVVLCDVVSATYTHVRCRLVPSVVLFDRNRPSWLIVRKEPPEAQQT